MKKLTSLFILLSFGVSFAQWNEMSGSEMCSQRKSSMPSPLPALFGDSQNSPRHKYDVLNYSIYVDIRQCFFSPYSRGFTGDVVITFRVDTALNQITLNAVNSAIVVNSVRLAGVSFTHTGDVLTVNLNRTYNVGETAQVGISYQRQNVTGNGFYAGNGGIFTDCEPGGARRWFPCWDQPSDKATIDLVARVPANAKLGSNGRLQDSLLIGDTLYYHWISRDPVATYLIVMTGKINYNLNIVYWHKISNPSDSIPIRFYFNSGENPVPIQNIIGDMTTYYSQKFGEHPFEKNGFCTAPAPGFNWGGMENQTLTTLQAGNWGQNLVSHEYAHQWYGDMVTCATWGDIWLNEGFASYAEALWYEHTGGYTAYKNDINSFANSYLSSNPGWAMWNPTWNEYTPSGTLFNYAITYAKGACVLHMLRYVLQDTSVFFNCMRGYAMDTAEFKYKSATTDDWRAKISQIAGQDLTWFVDEWVKQPNHPVYSNLYQFTTNGGNNWTVGFQARQTQGNSPFHKMPLTLRITFASGPDTTIRVMNDYNVQTWYWDFNRQPSTFTFDPNNDIVLKQGSTNQGTINGISENESPLKFELSQNYPNPFNASTVIRYQLAANSFVTLKLYDALGKELMGLVNEKQDAGSHQVSFDASKLPSGVYFYRIEMGDFKDTKKMLLVK
jgi:aminopeptidase N